MTPTSSSFEQMQLSKHLECHEMKAMTIPTYVLMWAPPGSPCCRIIALFPGACPTFHNMQYSAMVGPGKRLVPIRHEYFQAYVTIMNFDLNITWVLLNMLFLVMCRGRPPVLYRKGAKRIVLHHLWQSPPSVQRPYNMIAMDTSVFWPVSFTSLIPLEYASIQ